MQKQQNLSEQLLAWINRNKRTYTYKQTQTIEMMFPITRSELTLPVKNIGCLQKKRCVWPLPQLIQEVKANYDNKHNIRKEEGINLLNSEKYICKMCHQQSKLSDHRFFCDFYFDNSLNCLIRLAKQRYIDYQGGASYLNRNQNLKRQVYKLFKYSKLIIHPNGTVQLEFNQILHKKNSKTSIIVTSHDRIQNLSPQLLFNPKDYLSNISGLKITQNLAYKSIGESFDKVITEKLPNYSNQTKQLLNVELQNIISSSFEGKIHIKSHESKYAIKIVLNDRRKTAEMIVFDAGSNLTSVYSLNSKVDIAQAALRKQLCVLKLKQTLLVNTLSQTFILRFSLEDRIQKMKLQHLKFERQFTVTSQLGEIMNCETECKIQYLKYYYYQDFPEILFKCELIEQNLKGYNLLVDPSNEDNIFIVGGKIKNELNCKIFKLIKQKLVNNNRFKYKWEIQKQELKISDDHLLIIQSKQIFFLQGLHTESPNLISVQFIQNTLKIKQQTAISIKNPIQKGQYVPVKSKCNKYLLIDLYKRQPSYELDLKQKTIKQLQREVQINKILKSIGYSKYSISNSYDYLLNQIYHNQISYLLLESNKKIYIVYGCSNTWMISDICQKLVKQ